MDKTIRTIIGFGGETLNGELLETGCPATASAFIQQRNKLKTEAFECIFDRFTNSVKLSNLFHGYILLAFDGSDINTPYRKESEFYNPGEKNKNGTIVRGYNRVHLNAVYDLLNKTYLNYRIATQKQLSEQAAAVQMIDEYCGPKAIAIFDRGYPSYNLFEHVIRNENLDFIVRVSKKWYSRVNCLPMKELDVNVTTRITTTLSRYKSGQADICLSGESPFGKKKKSVTWDFGREDHNQTVRVIRFKLDTGEYETLVTSLIDRDAFPADYFKQLYHLRWGIETSFRELKYNIGITNLHTIKDEFILQEIVAKLIMYNYSMAIIMSVALPKMKRKHKYSIEKSTSITICRRFFKGRDTEITANTIEGLLLKYLQPIRPGRSGKRNIIPKGYVPFVYRVAA